MPRAIYTKDHNIIVERLKKARLESGFGQIKTLMRRQDKIVNNFSKKQQGLINEALNIEYKLAMVEQGYSLEDIK